ncbi:hypothetical protein DZF91_02165 [Actinomadura logoneensis]|uniref:YcaO domain-containing protein n=1 Tax=Actinomadura logoneensis TaxID=2293572 RepID=A0A372JTC3_9ACTN|nr:YcaO-like family protein [Actinomadura logoneensis]RFU43272.1 hypothetical protein DZF91_02165 [Actinomadura logoneensis]
MNADSASSTGSTGSTDSADSAAAAGDREPRIRATSTGTRLRPATARLMARALSPLTGISAGLDVVVPNVDDPRVTLMTGRLPTAHAEQHIAGTADSYDGAMTTVLAETLERHALHAPRPVLTSCYRDLAAHGRTLVPHGLRYFSDAQLRTPGFPFASLTPDTPIAWLPALSLRDETVVWIPAQTAVLAHEGQGDEPRFAFGTSAGTAAHTSFPAALRHALLELIQTDAAMGTWFGATAPRRFRPGDTAQRAVERRLRRGGPTPRFYWLPAPDLPAIAVACVLESPQIPRFAVGLGCDTRLNRAAYKAFLESTAVAKLATALVLRRPSAEPGPTPIPVPIHDLDTNVAHYATADPSAWAGRFGTEPVLDASDVPVPAVPSDDVRDLVRAFTGTGKDLACIDLTPADVRALGFRVVRVHSPDLLALTPPGIPPEASPRLSAYGGLANTSPHPYA